MKFQRDRVLSLTLILSFTLLAATSCKKSSGGGTGLSATVAGVSWSSTVPVAGIYESGGSQFEFMGLQIKGSDSVTVSLAFASPFTLNQAFSSDTAFVDLGFGDSRSQAVYDGGVGTGTGKAIVTITSYDQRSKTIAGTFSGVLYNAGTGGDSIVVTNGSFYSTYISQ